MSLRIAFGPDDGSRGLVLCGVSCHPATGTVPDPAAACSTLGRQPRMVLPRPTNRTCGGTLGAWAEGITGVYEGRSVHTHFDTCSRQMGEWMRLAGYRPCPGITCHHGPYAFGKAHMRGVYSTVPYVVGMSTPRARAVLARRGLVAVFEPKSPVTRAIQRTLVRTQSPRAGASLSVYPGVHLTIAPEARVVARS